MVARNKTLFLGKGGIHFKDTTGNFEVIHRWEMKSGLCLWDWDLEIGCRLPLAFFDFYFSKASLYLVSAFLGDLWTVFCSHTAYRDCLQQQLYISDFLYLVVSSWQPTDLDSVYQFLFSVVNNRNHCG